MEGCRWTCAIPKQSVKLMNRIIQCIEKFSEDVVLDVTKERLVFRAVNKSWSAFSQIIFDASFFEVYQAAEGFACYSIKTKVGKIQYKLVDVSLIFTAFSGGISFLQYN
jgi:hypothetical protein